MSITIARHGDIALVTVDSPPVNALSHAVRQGLSTAIEKTGADDRVRAIVIACGGNTFFAGADIREFGQAPKPPMLPEVIEQIEASQKPVIAAIHGTALGGGLEVALGCHFRIALPTARLGLPEVKLGLLPGAGGTQRLPRLIGAVPALQMIVSGEPVTAPQALKSGLIDAIVEGDLPNAALEFARRVLDENLPLRRLAETDEVLAPECSDPTAFDAAAAALLEKKRGFDAPEACVEAVRNAFTVPFEEGVRRERELFIDLRDGYQSAAQRHLFFAERAALKIPGMPEGAKARPVRNAAVIGAGTMGAGIAQCLAEATIPVVLIDPDKQALDRASATIAANLQRTAARTGKDAGWAEAIGALITHAQELPAAAHADLVIEAVYENLSLKHRIFAELDAIAKPEAVLATNTSTLDVNRIAAATKRPESVVGMHFFSPANVMRLLEVVQAEKTAPDVLKTAIETGKALRKLPVTVGVCHGFVGNRMLHARFGQVEALLLEGASPSEIDAAMTRFGFAMGPCAVSDLAGLDVGWRARVEAGRTAIVADAICRMGRFGQKTGVGYYRYRDGSRRGAPDVEIDALIAQLAEENGIERRQVPQTEIFERLVYSLINEGARILEEGIARRASDIDLIWVNGYGWPAYEGGPMFYADRIGPGVIARRLERHAQATGYDALLPAPLLLQLAREGGSLTQD